MSSLVFGFTTGAGWASAVSREKGTGGSERSGGNWIFDTCHFHSAAPCSLATHKHFSCHSSACYHEWAPGPRNPITTTVSDPCHHPYVCYSRVRQIRKDVPISSFSLLQFRRPPPLQSACLRYELRGLFSDWFTADSLLHSAAQAGGCLRERRGHWFWRSDIKWYHGADLTMVNNGEACSESACLPDAKQSGLCDGEIRIVRKAFVFLSPCPVGVSLMHSAEQESHCFPSFLYLPLSDTPVQFSGGNRAGDLSNHDRVFSKLDRYAFKCSHTLS